MNNVVENVSTNHRFSKFECQELEQAILLLESVVALSHGIQRLLRAER